MAKVGGFTEWFQEGLAKAKEVSVAGTGKPLAQVTSDTLIGTTAPLWGPGGMILLGGFGAVSAVVNQIEYNHRAERIASFYDEELAAKLHKSVKEVDAGDLTKLESGDRKINLQENNTIKGALKKERWVRNVGVVASFVASIAIFGLMTLAVGHPPMGWDLGTASRAVVGLLGYMALKMPLVLGARSMLGLNEETTHEKIVGLARDRAKGKSITREQVAEVFISGNKGLAEYVEGHFGKKYDDLVLADKVAVAKELSSLLPIATITQNINDGVTNASELAFTVEGQISGVLPKLPEKREHVSALSTFSMKCKQLANTITCHFKKTKAERADHVEGFSDMPQTPTAARREEEHASTNFASRFAKDKSPDMQGHVERLAQARAAQITAPSTQTIQ